MRISTPPFIHLLVLPVLLLLATNWTTHFTRAVDTFHDCATDAKDCNAECQAGGKLSKFKEWLTARGAEIYGIEVSDTPMGRGVVAVRDVREGEHVLRIPLNTVIWRGTISDHGSPGAASLAKMDTLEEGDLIACFLLLQLSLRESSEWAPYLQALPNNARDRSFIAGWQLGAVALNAFLEPPFANKLKAVRDSVARRWQSIVRSALDDAMRAEDVDDKENQKYLTLEWFEWASALVSSRALTFHGKRYLAPLVDMFNYASHASPRRAASGSFFLQHHMLVAKALEVKADRDVETGEQLFMDYGDNPSSVYLEYHGFIPKRNPFDCVTLYLSARAQDLLNKDSPQRALANKLGAQSALTKVCVHWRTAMAVFKQSPVYALERLAALSNNEARDCSVKLGSAIRSNIDVVWRQCMDWAGLPPKNTLLTLLAERRSMTQPDNSMENNHDNGVKLAIAYRMEQMRLLEETVVFLRNGVMPEVSDLKSFDVPSIEQASALLAARLDQTAFQRLELENAEDKLSLCAKIDRLNAWVTAGKWPVCKVVAALVPDIRVGTLATSAVAAEEPYLVVPARAVMDVASSARSAVFPWLVHLEENIGRPDDFHELLLFLVFERFVLGPLSEWWAYVALLPGPDEMLTPGFYNEQELALLEGHWVQAQARDSAAAVRRKHKAVVGFLRRSFGDKGFPRQLEAVLTEENYFWAHAILDSRSIWWGGQRHLVPLLDLVNCRAGLGRVHRTEEDSNGDAVTNAAEAVAQGEQLFEDYGQPNHVYFLYHGFSLEGNQAVDCFKLDAELTLSDHQRAAVERYRRKNPTPSRQGLKQGEFCLRAPLESSEANGDLLAAVEKGDESLLMVVRAMVQTQLAAFPSTLKDDIYRLQGLRPDEDKKRNALRFIISEKRLLKSILGQ